MHNPKQRQDYYYYKVKFSEFQKSPEKLQGRCPGVHKKPPKRRDYPKANNTRRLQRCQATCALTPNSFPTVPQTRVIYPRWKTGGPFLRGLAFCEMRDVLLIWVPGRKQQSRIQDHVRQLQSRNNKRCIFFRKWSKYKYKINPLTEQNPTNRINKYMAVLPNFNWINWEQDSAFVTLLKYKPTPQSIKDKSQVLSVISWGWWENIHCTSHMNNLITITHHNNCSSQR